jgi:hypothetical protein
VTSLDASGYSGWVQIESAVPKGMAMPAAYKANLQFTGHLRVNRNILWLGQPFRVPRKELVTPYVYCYRAHCCEEMSLC